MDNSKMHLSEPWAQVKEKIKEANVDLTDEDLDYTPGKEEEFLSRLAKKMNRSPAEVRDWIESISANKGKAS